MDTDIAQLLQKDLDTQLEELELMRDTDEFKVVFSYPTAVGEDIQDMTLILPIQALRHTPSLS